MRRHRRQTARRSRARTRVPAALAAVPVLGVLPPGKSAAAPAPAGLTVASLHATGPVRRIEPVHPLAARPHTAPDLHDGSVDDLGDAIRVMARHRLGRPVTAVQVCDIAAIQTTPSGGMPGHLQ